VYSWGPDGEDGPQFGNSVKSKHLLCGSVLISPQADFPSKSFWRSPTRACQEANGLIFEQRCTRHGRLIVVSVVTLHQLSWLSSYHRQFPSVRRLFQEAARHLHSTLAYVISATSRCSKQ